MSRLSPVLFALISTTVLAASEAAEPAAVVLCSPDGSVQERLAAAELRRYAYLRTATMLTVTKGEQLPDRGDVIVVANKGHPIVARVISDPALRNTIAELQPQQYMLKTVQQDGRRVLAVIGGDAVGTLYGAYRMAEHLGVRFFLHGDVLPDVQTAWELPDLDDTGRPLFALRGVNPWGSHPFGFDLWNTDDYKAHIGQLAKMRMNFIGMHCYPEGHPFAEPTVWVGLPGDFDAQGRVDFSYPSNYFNALFRPPWGSIFPKETGKYLLGSAVLFDRDDWGPEVMRDCCPRPTTPEACNTLFNRTGAMYGEAFSFARLVGVKTCLGTESPLTMPAAVRRKLTAAGRNPTDPAVVAEVYEGMFRRIAAAHPLDYYWLWTPEGWTWGGNSSRQMKATVDDIKIAQAALAKAGSPFQLATCGWVLGPQNDRSALDRELSPEVALSAISRHLGEDPVDPAYGQIKRPGKWAIPWMEGDNGGLAVPQLWVGRTRQDAVDAKRYGCNGLMGLIWRTRILGPNIATLARAGWEQPWDEQAEPTASPAIPPNPVEGARGGKVANYAGAAVAGTEDDVLYQSCRYDTGGYDLKVPGGTYRVTLQFCEPHFDSADQRVCDVKVQGKTVIEKLDIFGQVGKFAALDHSIEDVRVSDERLAIELVYVKSLPCISGITVTGADFTRKINCGGPAYKDYAADFPPPASANVSLRMRKVPCEDFYTDWSTALFGSESAEPIAAIFAQIDSRLPRPLSAGCPAGLRPNARPWEQVAPAYAFVDELAACRAKVTGPGNLERFDYWLGTMQYLRAGAKLDCAVGKFHQVLAKINAEKDPARRKQAAEDIGLPAYRDIVAAYTEGFGHLLDTTTTNGALATVMFWERSIYPAALGNTGKTLAQALGSPLPADVHLAKTYSGRPRLIVPTIRTSVVSGETLHVQATVLSAQKPREVALHWRPLGTGPFAKIPMPHVARGVYRLALPAEATRADLEYYIEATIGDQTIRFPATAPVMNQTVVVMPE